MYVTQNLSVVDIVRYYLREISHRQTLKQLIVLNVNTGQFLSSLLTFLSSLLNFLSWLLTFHSLLLTFLSSLLTFLVVGCLPPQSGT
jgi:hypothetical protein